METAALGLHQLFQQQVARTPQALAVVDEGHAVTYAEMDRRTDALAGYLQQHGLGSDRHAGIFMEKCADYIVAYIAILKAGGAYLTDTSTYDCTHFDRAVSTCGIARPATDGDYFARLLA